MANDLTGDPWKIDTAAGNTTTPAATGQLTVTRVRWVGASTAGHACILKDGQGRVRWHSIASGSNYVEGDSGFAANGLIVDTIQSGTLYLYFS